MSGSAKMTVTNYSQSGEPFVQRLHAESIQNKFYLTEGIVVPDSPLRRALLHTASRTDQFTAIGLALVLSAAILACLGLNPSEVPSSFSSILSSATTVGSMTNAEIIPVCITFLLSVFIVALKDASEVSSGAGAPETSDTAVTMSLLIAVAVVAIEAPFYPTGGPIAGVLVALLLIFTNDVRNGPRGRVLRSATKDSRQSMISLILTELEEYTHQPVRRPACCAAVLLRHQTSPPNLVTNLATKPLLS